MMTVLRVFLFLTFTGVCLDSPKYGALATIRACYWHFYTWATVVASEAARNLSTKCLTKMQDITAQVQHLIKNTESAALTELNSCIQCSGSTTFLAVDGLYYFAALQELIDTKLR